MLLDCGHEESPHLDITTGYGTTPDGKKHCYECCAKHDREYMTEHGRIDLYLVKNENGQHDITNWPGSLRIHVYHLRHGRHNMARTRTDVWFSFNNEAWHGVQYGKNTQVCHCKRIKA